jgi:hypothetical protein
VLQWLRRRGSSWLLRQLLAEQRLQSAALVEIARVLRAQAAPGFRTGAPDGADQSSVSYTRDSDIVELLTIEQELARAFGRAPTNDEVVREWEERGR